MKRKAKVLSVALAMAAGLGAHAGSALAQQNGTTLAATKDMNICVVTPGTWQYYGVISVWNAGAIDTAGLLITDTVEQKNASGPNWTGIGGTCSPVANITPPAGFGGQIPAGTTEQTATVFTYVCEGPAATRDVRNTAFVKITNHSGRLGQLFGPEPKYTIPAADFANLPSCQTPPTGCTRTIGYWGNHHEVWPAGFSPNDPFYNSPTDTWGSLLPPVNSGPNSSGYYQLARQFVAAKLNQANGAAVPSSIATWLGSANTFFSSHVPADCGTNGCALQKAWAAILDSYNNGEYPGGPTHCN